MADNVKAADTRKPKFHQKQLFQKQLSCFNCSPENFTTTLLFGPLVTMATDPDHIMCLKKGHKFKQDQNTRNT